MKNLWQNLAKNNPKFVWKSKPTDTATSPETVDLTELDTLKKSLNKMRELAREETIGDLAALKNNTALKKVLDHTKEQLNEYRQKLMAGNAKPPLLDEETVKQIIDETMNGAGAELQKELGLNLNTVDNDDKLDLDEFIGVQRMSVNNIMAIIKTFNELPEPTTPQIKKIQTVLNNIAEELPDLVTSLESQENNDSISRDKIENKIKNIIMLALRSVKGLDLGIMVQELATLAKKESAHLSTDDIDKIVADFLNEESVFTPPSEKKEIASQMERLVDQNKELAKFLVDYYPPGDFETDLRDFILEKHPEYKGKTISNEVFISEIPDFFWSGKPGIKSALENFEGKYANLKNLFDAERKNGKQSSSMGNGLLNFYDLATGHAESNIPIPFRKLNFSREELEASTTSEELFKNRMGNLVNGEHINFAGIKELARPLVCKDGSKDSEMILRLSLTVPPEWEGDENSYGEKYRLALKEGKTRKPFLEWLNGNPNVTSMEKVGNFISNWMTKIAKLCVSIGIFKGWGQKYLDSIGDAGIDKSTLHSEFKNNNITAKEERHKSANKDKWINEKNTNPQLYQDFIKFHQKYKGVLDIEEINTNPSNAPTKASELPNAFEKVSPEDFYQWNNAKSRDILDWAKGVVGERVSLENWKIVVGHQDQLKVDSTKNVLKNIDKGINVDKWTNKNILDLIQESPRELQIKKLQEKGVIDESIDVIKLIKNYEEDLYENTSDINNKNFRPIFAGLLTNPNIKTFREKPLSLSDIETIIANKNKLVDELDTKVSFGTQLFGRDNDYYHMHEGELVKIVDGEISSDKSADFKNKGQRVPTFEVDIEGESSGNILDVGQDFDSVEAFVERLKQTN